MEEVKEQVDSLTTEMSTGKTEAIEAKAEATSAKAERDVVKVSLEAQQESQEDNRVLEEVKGYKNLNLGEDQAKLLRSLEKTDPTQATILRQTLKDSNARMSANLTPKGSATAAPVEAGPAIGKSAGELLDERVFKLVEQGTVFKVGEEGKAAHFILERDQNLAAQLAAESNPALRGTAEEL